MHRFAHAPLLAAALLLCPAPASAQDQLPERGSEEIVVTGQRDLESQVSDFVGALTQAPPRGQLSRFERSLCPAAFGLSESGKQAVAGRLRQLARAVGIEVGKAGCVPNALLLVTADKPALMQGLARRYPHFFTTVSRGEMRRLMKGEGPAAAWQMQGPMLNADGREIAEEEGVAANRTGRTASRISTAIRPQFAAAVVVVERSALDGLTTTQLADYAAMRLFARTDPSRLANSAAPTIVTILEAPMGSPVPLTLTEWDLAFLRGLYSGSNNLYAAARRSEIGEQVAGALQREPGKEEAKTGAPESAGSPAPR
jgi:hypothetical protein